MASRVRKLHDFGQAPWLDFVDRRFLKEGGLQRLVEEDGVTGVTSNPSIFEKAIAHGDAYDAQLLALLQSRPGTSITQAYEALAVQDIQDAADTLQPVYERLNRTDGYVSLEVSPYLAESTEETVAEAQRLWRQIDRPNLMIKVPGTQAGVPAIRQLIEDGININVTLLFGQQSYAAVAMAFVEGLEARLAQGQPIDRIASVASFFVSRIDAAIDRKIAERLKSADAEAEALTGLRGQVAIANAKLAYQWYLGLVASERWQALVERRAMPQRLLWASTGTKDPSYPDTLYVDNLIGPETVNTLPPKTMDAFRDHGTLAPSLTAEVESARRILREVDRLGLDLPAVADELVRDGVKQFADAADALLGAVAAKRSAIVGDGLNSMHEALPRELDEAVEARLERMRQESWSRRLWAGDATLWTGGEEAKWLGWLAAGKGEQIDPEALKALGAQAAQYRSAVLFGMGGSSLGPEVLAEIVGPRSGSPMIHVLDTTDPKQIAAVAAAIDPEHTLFIVASKSGSTMEPELLRAYFWNLAGQDGSRFIAITDPGSRLAKIAHDHGYAGVFLGDPTIGGRYSVLSVFGMVPAAVMGMDVAEFFTRVAPMVQSCAPDAPPAFNPGMRLGAILGEAANRGRDKVTVLTSPALRAFGAWLEQLLAESTGKQGRGIVPVDLEPPLPPAHYGSDRLFVLLSLTGDDDAGLGLHADALVTSGQPVVRIALSSKEMIGQEFFRWEIAAAVAGAVIGINPFDQPDVEDAKIRTRVLIDAFEATGSLAPETPFFEDGRVAFFRPADRGHIGDNAVEILRIHLARLGPGDYVGFLLYVERNRANEALVARMRERVVKARHVATVAGFGPRFLHSTGQAYKGGPRSGVFLEITRTPDPDVPIPGRKASFGTVQLAQARGDLDVLASRGQRVLRVHLQSASLSDLEELLDEALRN
ncbi:bifunctional transaldolase/phosoglucose isomerase [Sphingomonas paucimobilis]|uniref:bifunctional transaldolase/phosoglucose isomerase n=1 Tax=Sphingomonas paucimobilis TaxID=13689 RepID=UPI00064C432B|nr:bifunctional transaldolase/phosoglucose isomerase [Sphingomonas paucimobilis]